MKLWIKTYWKTLLFFVVCAIVGGFFVGLYALDSYPEWIRQQAMDQLGSRAVLGLVTAVQSVGYALFCGVIGIILGKKVGLWKDERHFEKKPLQITLLVALAGGVGIILPDLLIFGKYSQAILDSYAVKPSLDLILGSVIYGGVIEEVMLRLFFLSLVAFLLNLIFGKRGELPSEKILVVANVIAALLFAAGHLPVTILTIGLSPMILVRCFLLNGGFGLAFGWLYRKHGLRYAMIAHAGCHVVSKLIWILFI